MSRTAEVPEKSVLMNSQMNQRYRAGGLISRREASTPGLSLLLIALPFLGALAVRLPIPITTLASIPPRAATGTPLVAAPPPGVAPAPLLARLVQRAHAAGNPAFPDAVAPPRPA